MSEEHVHLPEDVALWDAGALVEEAKECGRRLAIAVKGEPGKKEVGKTQVRAILDELIALHTPLKGICWEEDGDLLRRRMPLLRPKLAYIASRHRALGPFVKELDGLLERSQKHVNDAQSLTKAFENVFTFVESVVAYFSFSLEFP